MVSVKKWFLSHPCQSRGQQSTAPRGRCIQEARADMQDHRSEGIWAYGIWTTWCADMCRCSGDGQRMPKVLDRPNNLMVRKMTFALWIAGKIWEDIERSTLRTSNHQVLQQRHWERGMGHELGNTFRMFQTSGSNRSDSDSDSAWSFPCAKFAILV